MNYVIQSFHSGPASESAAPNDVNLVVCNIVLVIGFARLVFIMLFDVFKTSLAVQKYKQVTYK